MTLRVKQIISISTSVCLLLLLFRVAAFGHGVSGADAHFLNENEGFRFFVYLYLGAKHMVTGYDHLMFLFGVIFYLGSLRSIALYVSLFALGHSITLLTGVLADIQVNVYLIDAIIGLSVIYKAFDNIGGFKHLFGTSPDDRIAVWVFGLFHGFGLATKLQELSLSNQGLVANLLSFNLGVEIGQLLALTLLLLLLNLGRKLSISPRAGIYVNIALMAGGFSLTFYHLAYYFMT